MRTFIVHKKKGQAVPFQGYSYTEDAGEKRIYFHKKEDQSDKDSFVLISDVFGVDEELPRLSPKEEEEQMLSSPEFEAALRQMLAKIEKKKTVGKRPDQSP